MATHAIKIVGIRTTEKEAAQELAGITRLSEGQSLDRIRERGFIFRGSLEECVSFLNQGIDHSRLQIQRADRFKIGDHTEGCIFANGKVVVSSTQGIEIFHSFERFSRLYSTAEFKWVDMSTLQDPMDTLKGLIETLGAIPSSQFQQFKPLLESLQNHLERLNS